MCVTECQLCPAGKFCALAGLPHQQVQRNQSVLGEERARGRMGFRDRAQDEDRRQEESPSLMDNPRGHGRVGFSAVCSPPPKTLPLITLGVSEDRQWPSPQCRVGPWCLVPESSAGASDISQCWEPCPCPLY